MSEADGDQHLVISIANAVTKNGAIAYVDLDRGLLHTTGLRMSDGSIYSIEQPERPIEPSSHHFHKFKPGPSTDPALSISQQELQKVRDILLSDKNRRVLKRLGRFNRQRFLAKQLEARLAFPEA